MDREHSGNVLLIDRKCSSDVLLIDQKLVKLKDDAKYESLLKLTKLVKKLPNLINIRKKKPHCPISHSLTCFIELIGQPCFCFAEGLMNLMGLTNGLAISRAELRRGEIAVGFSG